MDTRTQEEKETWIKDKSRENGGLDHNDIRFIKSGWCQRRTDLEKGLLALLVLVLLGLIAVIIVLVHAQNGKKTTETSNICLTKECVSAAASVSDSIDYSVEPCNDFYQFACGKWMEKNIIPEDKSVYTIFTMLIDQVDVVIKNLLEVEETPADLVPIKKAKDFYASCMNTTIMDTRGADPLKQLLMDNFKGWPLTTASWQESSFDLEDTLVRANTYGSNPIIHLYVSIDNKNSTKRILKIDQPSFGIDGQKYYEVPRDDPILMAYEDLIFSLGQLMGFANEATARADVKDIVDFEIMLANISVPDEKRRDSNSLYNPMTLLDIHSNYSKSFNWTRYVISKITYPGIGLSDVTLNETIINKVPSYFEKLADLMENTDRKTLANYVVWITVWSLSGTIGEIYKQPIRTYFKVIHGTSSDPAQFRFCTSLVTSNMGLAVGNMFIKENFQATAKYLVMEMISGLQGSFNNLLDDLDWMDAETKRVAQEKNEHISTKIGYPDEITNGTYLDEYYSNFTFARDEYFENIVSVRQEQFRTSFRDLRKPIDKNKWQEAPSTINAFYNAHKNQIMFPAGILQPPFFSENYPRSLNYGGIGVVIGHEITHGFDDRGRQYDKEGNLVSWWSKTAVEKFKTKTECIINQYGNFTVEEIRKKMNGVNTQGENIADNGGLKQAFRAYRDWVNKNGKEEPALPGLKFTNNQLFFINFAQLWCNLMREGNALKAVRTGVHSPGRFRVIGSVQNSVDFAKEFNCPAKSNMNPEKKCNVW